MLDSFRKMMLLISFLQRFSICLIKIPTNKSTSSFSSSFKHPCLDWWSKRTLLHQLLHLPSCMTSLTPFCFMTRAVSGGAGYYVISYFCHHLVNKQTQQLSKRSPNSRFISSFLCFTLSVTQINFKSITQHNIIHTPWLPTSINWLQPPAETAPWSFGLGVCLLEWAVFCYQMRLKSKLTVQRSGVMN